MINYSTCMRGNPTDKDAAKKAYANALRCSEDR